MTTAFSSEQEDAISRVATIFPGSVIELPRNKAEEFADEMIAMIANLVRVNQGKTVSKRAIHAAVRDILVEGLLAANRLCDGDNRNLADAK